MIEIVWPPRGGPELEMLSAFGLRHLARLSRDAAPAVVLWCLPV